MSEGMLGGYRLAEKLGEGGMGTVHRARQLALDREVALKLLRHGIVGAADEHEHRFQREMQIAAQLAHPGLVRVLDGGTVDGVSYIAMELVRGKPLVELIIQAAPLAWPFALSVVSRVAEALAYLHERDILHRDIKPSNILISKDGEVKLADFGLARYSTSTLVTEDGAVVGTLQFMAPELLVGDQATPATEVWALGCVLYVMLTGRMHVESEGSAAFARAVVNDPVRPPGLLVPGLPQAVSQLVLALLEKDPRERIASARDVQERADELLERLGGHRADRILKAGVVDDIAIWRALPAEDTEEERTVSVQVATPRARAGGDGLVRAGPAPRSRTWPAAAVMLVAFAALVLALRPVRPPQPVASAGASSTTAAPSSEDASEPPARAIPRWFVPARYFERLKSGGPEAARAAAELSARHPVPLGDDPAVWLHAYRLAVWFADRARAALPPHLLRTHDRTLNPLLIHNTNEEVRAAQKKGVPALASLAIRMVGDYPDEPRAWLLLGYALELLDANDPSAAVALKRGIDLLGHEAYERSSEPFWLALGRALIVCPPRDLERRWFEWLGDEQTKFYAWQALRTAIEAKDGALYERMLERGVAMANANEQASYYLGLRRAEVHGDRAGAEKIWRAALERAPRSGPIRDALRLDK